MHTINWVDFAMLAILGLGINSGRKSDFFTELIILLGTMFAAALSLHYYVRFGNFLDKHFVLSENSDDVLGFIIIAGVLIGLTILVKGGWLVILKINIKREIDNWCSLIFAFIKSVFLCSLVLFALVISPRKFLEKDVRKSYSFIVFHKPALWAYSVCYTGLISPLFKEEPINQKAFRAVKSDTY